MNKFPKLLLLYVVLLITLLSASSIRAAPYAQPEDKLIVAALDCFQGKQPSNAEWRNNGIAKGPRDVGPSANWYALAAAEGVCAGDAQALAGLRLVMAEPNDYAQGETATDDGHALLRLYGLMLARRELLDRHESELAAAVDAEVMQWWAMHWLTNASPDAIGKPVFITAGQRPVRADDGPWLEEYLFLRGVGRKHSEIAPPMRNAAERVHDHQGGWTAQRFADLAAADLRTDVTRLTDAYATGGWPSVGRFLVKGSRGSLHFLRFSGGGYVSVSERDFGLAAPRWVAMAERDQVPAVQFPAPTTPRQDRAGGGRLDQEKRLVLADDAIHGKFSRPFPAGEVVYHVHLDPTGVHVLTGGAPSPASPPPPANDNPAPTAPAQKRDKGGSGCAAVLLLPPSAWAVLARWRRQRTARAKRAA